MPYQPPISSRTDAQLLEIITKAEDWEPAAVDQARSELVRRGIHIEEQQSRAQQFKEEERRRLFAKANASYSWIELGLIVLLAPVGIVLLQEIRLLSAPDSYKKKRKQGWIALGFGFLLWAIYIYWSVS